MWLATEQGFYNILQKELGCYSLRAEHRQDLEDLLQIGGVVAEVHFSRMNALPYGIIIGPQSLLSIMTKLAFVVLYQGQGLGGSAGDLLRYDQRTKVASNSLSKNTLNGVFKSRLQHN
jgi:hypothetical protein